MFGWLSAASTLRLALEARQAVAVRGEGVGQDLDRDVALQPGVARAIHLAHAACADSREDLVGADARAGGMRHATAILSLRHDCVD